MGEEILSPTSDPSRTPPQEHHQANDSGKARSRASPRSKASKRKSIGERRFTDQKSTEEKGATKRTDSPSRTKWPGLNVVTDFSKGMDTVGNLRGPHMHQPRAKEKGSHEREIPVNRHKVEGSQDNVKDGREAHQGHRRSGKSLKGSGSKGRLDDLKRSSTKSSNLSPSDRAVMIGLSVEEDGMIHQNESSGGEQGLGPVRNTHQRRPSLTPSIAPSIVVTPANEQRMPWSQADEEKAPPLRRRPSSSVYSQFPPSMPRQADPSRVPPVPPLPTAAIGKTNSGEKVKGRSQRVMSNCTIFDEEPCQDAVAQSRPQSRESQMQILAKTTSNDTCGTKRRSQGWWNVIKSPFFPKSPMSAKFQLSPDDKDPLPKESHPGHDRQHMSPENPSRFPKSQIAESAHTSWTDSSVELECEKRAMDFGEPIPNSQALDTQPKAHMPRESYFINATFEGLGAASEYFEASLYDMHSSTPYFECQNHKCWPSTLGVGGYLPRGIERPDSPPAVRGMALGMAHKGGEKSKEGDRLEPAPLQPPTNRFSASFREAVDGTKGKTRPQSDVTVIEDLDVTPAVHEAKAAPIFKAPEPVSTVTPPIRKDSLARQTSTIHSSPFFNKPDPEPKVLPPPPPRLPEKDATPPPLHRELEEGGPRKPFVTGLPSNPRHKTLEQPMSPLPLTPGAQKPAVKGGIPLTEVREVRESSPGPSYGTQNTYITNHYHPNHRRDRSGATTTTTADLWTPPRPPRPAESLESWHFNEKHQIPVKETKKSKTGFGIASLKSCVRRRHGLKKRSATPKDEKKRRRLIIIVLIALLLLIVLILVLAMTLTRRGDKMSAESQWLNITGYPPIPTGISTIAQPDAAHEESGCVQPTSMWSCALPKEEQEAIKPNAPNQPNFRVEIRFQNGTNMTTGNTSSLDTRSLEVSNPLTADHFIRTKLLRARNAFTNALFSSDPSPPSEEDQQFLGNSTDNVHAPFDGEFTPFYMTIHSSAPLASRLLRRGDSDSGSSDSNNSFPDIASAIPDASTNLDGTASPAQLYPYPSAQPLRLFNRGRPDEYYGFYTYFSRSIFLKSTAPLNASAITGNTPPTEPADADGGCEEKAASVRCTWQQTRFLVRIWTNKGDNFTLLQNNNSTSDSPSKQGKSKAGNDDPDNKDQTESGNTKTNLTSSSSSPSANDFARPGSFPYPITITLDRHGGDIEKKMIYCYGLDNFAKPISDSKKLQLEDREFGGTLVNPARGPWKDVKVKKDDGGPGGIDGGSGGCECRWQNFK